MFCSFAYLYRDVLLYLAQLSCFPFLWTQLIYYHLYFSTYSLLFQPALNGFASCFFVFFFAPFSYSPSFGIRKLRESLMLGMLGHAAFHNGLSVVLPIFSTVSLLHIGTVCPLRYAICKYFGSWLARIYRILQNIWYYPCFYAKVHSN